MDDILAYLEELTYPDSLPREYFALQDRVNPYADAILKQFPMSFLDGLTEVRGEVTRWERQEAFSRGFRLGVRLTLSALQ